MTDETIVDALPPQVVGFIGKASDAEAPAPFMVNKTKEKGACEHLRTIEYTEHGELTCGECGVPLEAFGIVMRMAHWHAKLEAYRTKVIGYHIRWLNHELSEMKKHKAVTPEHRKRIEIASYFTYTDKNLTDLISLQKETSRMISDWKWSRQADRRQSMSRNRARTGKP